MRRSASIVFFLTALGAAAGEALMPAEPQAVDDIIFKKLNRKISFEFTETPVEEALMFFVSLTKLNVIVEPDAVAEKKTVSLKVTDVPMNDAFQQILQIAGLEMQIGRFAVYVVKKGSPKREETMPLEPVADWEKALVKKLQEKEAIQFVDVPLGDALVMLGTKSKTTIVAANAKLRELQINLPPRELTLEDTLMEVLRMSDLHCEFFHGGILVRRNGEPRPEELKSFDPHSESEKAIQKKLQRNVSFEFADTPFPEAINFLNSLTKISVVVDPAIDPNLSLSLRVQDITMEDALLWIMRLTGTRYMLRDDALFLFAEGAYPDEPETLTGKQTEAFKKSLVDLSSEDFDTREHATQSIVALGTAARPMLESAAASAKDAESAARITALLANLPQRMNFDETPEVTKFLEAELFSRKVTFDYVDVPLAEGIRFLNVSGNLSLEWDRKADEPVNLRVQDVEMRNALRWVVRLGGGRLSLENGVLKVISQRTAN